MKLQINPIPAYNDNYIWIIHNDEYALVVDPGLAQPVNDYLNKNQLKLKTIIITHHHWDHINGVEELVNNWSCQIYGPNDDRIPFKMHVVQEGDEISDLDLGIHFNVIETPGHTLSHICYHNNKLLFCGDTLFSLGCGRMFEGTAEQFTASLNKIKQLNNDIAVYCTHEYTQSNLDFALSLEPKNKDLLSKMSEVNQLRSTNKPTIPVTLSEELKLNPFLRADNYQFQRYLSQQFNTDLYDEVTCFAHLRSAKNQYK